MTTPSEDRLRQEEAGRILRRVRQETEPQTGAAAERMTHSVTGHFLGRDADPKDRIEVWGTRIGRGAGLVAFAVLLFVFANQFLSG